jgi:hypothetical protein
VVKKFVGFGELGCVWVCLGVFWGVVIGVVYDGGVQYSIERG